MAGEVEKESNDGVAKKEDEVGVEETGSEAAEEGEEGREVSRGIGNKEEGSGELGETESSREGAQDRGSTG